MTPTASERKVYSPGVLRAAERILRLEGEEINRYNVAVLAQVIEKHTAATELLEALKRTLTELQNYCDEHDGHYAISFEIQNYIATLISYS